MEHDHAVEQDAANRYLSGQLSPDERAAFEEHFVDCPLCLDALDGADELGLGLKTMAAQDALSAAHPPARQWWTARRALFSAAAVAAAVIMAVGVADFVATKRELVRVSRLAADLTGQSDRAQSLIRTLSDRVQQLENAPATTAMAGGPSSALVFALTTVRGGGTSTPPNRVTLSGTAGWIVLTLELDDPNVSGRYRATLRDGQRRERWRDDQLKASAPDTLGVALPAALFDEGDYTLDVERQPDEGTAWIAAGRYAFRAVRRR